MSNKPGATDDNTQYGYDPEGTAYGFQRSSNGGPVNVVAEAVVLPTYNRGDKVGEFVVLEHNKLTDDYTVKRNDEIHRLTSQGIEEAAEQLEQQLEQRNVKPQDNTELDALAQEEIRKFRGKRTTKKAPKRATQKKAPKRATQKKAPKKSTQKKAPKTSKKGRRTNTPKKKRKTRHRRTKRRRK
jgi:cell division septation protein DedD